MNHIRHNIALRRDGLGRRDVLFADRIGTRSRRGAGQGEEGQAGRGQAAGGEKPAGGESRLSEPVNLAPPEDPVVTALLASNPTTPSEIFRTAQLLLEAGRPELAKRFLKKLLDAKLDDGQWTALVDEFHTPAFTDLAGRTRIAAGERRVDPRGPRRRQSPPARPGPHRRADQAIAGPVARGPRTGPGGPAEGARRGVSALIAVLADPQRAAEHAAVRAALAAMRGDAIDPLADIIERADPELMVQAIEALAQMRATQATVYLFVPALSEDSDLRVRAAARAAIVQLHGSIARARPRRPSSCTTWREATSPASRSMRIDVDGRVTLWTWDPAAKQCTSRNCRAGRCRAGGCGPTGPRRPLAGAGQPPGADAGPGGRLGAGRLRSRPG